MELSLVRNYRMGSTRLLLLLINFTLFLTVKAQLPLSDSKLIESKSEKEKGPALEIEKFYGPPGSHIIYDEEGKPYLNCAKFSPSECDPVKNGSCPASERCYVDGQRETRPACMAVWWNSTETGVKVSLKGCWNHDPDQLRDCGNDRCIADLRTAGEGRTTMFCCCRTNNCNELLLPLEENVNENDADLNPLLRPPIIRRNDPFKTILLIIIPICFLAVLLCCLYWAFRHHQLNKHHKYGLANGNLMPSIPPQFTYGPGQKHRNIELFEVTARGRFGRVHRATLNHCTVAVKIFPASDVDSWVQEQEIYALNAIKAHPNVLQFVGSEVHGAGPTAEYWLITVFQQNGSLSDYLKSKTLTIVESIHIATTLLRGLAFLHEESTTKEGKVLKPTIVHRDFKSRNILLKPDLTACVADFGLALLCENGRTMEDTHGQVGTRRYMAPEVLEGATEFSAFAFRQIDVYAAGLVIWEVLSRTRTDPGAKCQQQLPTRLDCRFVDPFLADDLVGDYKLPYELETSAHPTLSEMRDVVVNRKLRPIVRSSIRSNQYGSVMCHTMDEMWDMETEGRITTGCALERLAVLTPPSNDTNSQLDDRVNRLDGHRIESSPLIRHVSACPDTIVTSLMV